MGQRLFGGPRYLFHYFILSSIVATFAALVWGKLSMSYQAASFFSCINISAMALNPPPLTAQKRTSRIIMFSMKESS